ncbi:MAG: BirA family biotin operon repressor/biotin-[acetyl-CoA-carboxylase] ligase [Pirellulaceae bacterium]|jgi:BirA family biotin operon repressor/biotin-[acetyl-CoA-carboxylase] ligase
MQFSAEALASLQNAREIGEFEFHSEIDSTNNRGLKVATQSILATPTVILAERQTSGRGRGGNEWWSASGSLTFSMVFDNQAMGIDISAWPILSLLAGVSVCQTLENLVPGADLAIKWPNDVFLSGRKVCGILVETVSKDKERVVIGVGINVNNTFREAPAELRETANSLIDQFGQRQDRAAVLLAVVRHTLANIAKLARGADVASQWQERCFLQTREIAIDTGTETVTGICLGVADDGTLQLDVAGQRRSFFAGVVKSYSS